MAKPSMKSIKWYEMRIEFVYDLNVMFTWSFRPQLDCRETAMQDDDIDYYEDDEFIKRKSNCTIFLGFTSNIVSSGVRETIRFLVQHKMVNDLSQIPVLICLN